MAARRRRRRQPDPPAPSGQAPEYDEPLSPWATSAIAAGRLNEAEHRDRLHRNRERRRADFARRVPPVVVAEGPDAVAAWIELMLDRDPRLGLIERTPPDPREPLPPVVPE